jgi:hypothetical protein
LFQHFIKFCDEQGLYIVHANMPDKHALARHHQEAGEHFGGKTGADSAIQLEWVAELGQFPEQPLLLDWSAQPQNRDFALALVSRRMNRYGEWSDVKGAAGGGNSGARAVQSRTVEGQSVVNYAALDSLPQPGLWQLAYGCIAITVLLLALKQLIFGDGKQDSWTTDALQVVCIGFLCYFCDVMAPTVERPPAAPSFQLENLDLWSACALVMFAVSVAWTRTVPAAEQVPLNRAQCNEWKGWMMLLFVLYHVCVKPERMYGSVLFVPIRIFVSTYIWLTG